MSFGKFAATMVTIPFFALGVIVAWPCLAFYYGCIHAYQEING